MKDRHRCEIMFIARIMHVASSAIRYETTEAQQEFDQLAWEAVAEAANGLHGKQKEVLRRRVQRMEDVTICKDFAHLKAEKIILVGYHFIQMLLDRDYVNLPDESKLQRVINVLFTFIDLDHPVTQKRLATSAKQAKVWLETLKKQGYYE